MAKSEAVKAIAHDARLSQEEASVTYQAIIDTVVRTLRRGEEVRLPEVGTLYVTRKPARNGRKSAANGKGRVVGFRPYFDAIQYFVDVYRRL